MQTGIDMDKKKDKAMAESSVVVDCSQCGWLGLCTIGCPYPHPEQIVHPNCTTAPGLEAELDETEFSIIEQTPGETDRTS